jgi:hypothetical protein
VPDAIKSVVRRRVRIIWVSFPSWDDAEVEAVCSREMETNCGESKTTLAV